MKRYLLETNLLGKGHYNMNDKIYTNQTRTYRQINFCFLLYSFPLFRPKNLSLEAGLMKR